MRHLPCAHNMVMTRTNIKCTNAPVAVLCLMPYWVPLKNWDVCFTADNFRQARSGISPPPTFLHYRKIFHWVLQSNNSNFEYAKYESKMKQECRPSCEKPQTLHFCKQRRVFDVLVIAVSLLLKTSLTCYFAPISRWRTSRVKNLRFITPVWHGWMVRIHILTHKSLFIDKVLITVWRLFNEVTYDWATGLQQQPLVLFFHSNSTRPSSVNSTFFRERSCSSHQRGTCPVVQPHQQHNHNSAGQQLPGE